MYQQLFELQADFLKALAHPRRLEIVQLLRDQELCVSDIYEMLDLPQANISQHLMILRDAQVVATKRDGKQVVYRLTDQKVIDLVDCLREVLVTQHQGQPLADQLMTDMAELWPLTHDVVCGMRVSPKAAHFRHSYQGQTYYFCASGCLKKFTERPQAYVKP